MATPSPEVTHSATTALSVWIFPCSKFPSAVASLVPLRKAHTLAQRYRWALLQCPLPQLLFLLLLPAGRLLLLAPAAHIWATALSISRPGVCWGMFGLRNVSPQRDFNTQLQLQEGWERHSLPQRWVKGATGVCSLRPGRVRHPGVVVICNFLVVNAHY